MNGLPDNFDASPFVSQTLEAVSFGQYQVALRFTNNIVINVESHFSVNDSKSMGLRDVLASLYDLINLSVEAASSLSSGTLRLTFENQTTLDILDSNDRYESYSIALADKELIVV
jgi:Family of unknown function (DUF6188)